MSISSLPYTSQRVIKLTTYVCSLVENRTQNLLVYGKMLQPTQPPNQGSSLSFLLVPNLVGRRKISMEMKAGLITMPSSLMLPVDELPAHLFLSKYLLGPYCVSDIVLGFDDTNLKNILPLRWGREKHKSVLEFIYSGHRNSVSVELAWAQALVFLNNFPKCFLVQPGTRATAVCKETLDDILQ